MVRVLSLLLAVVACTGSLAADLLSLRHHAKQHAGAAHSGAAAGCIDLVPRRIQNSAEHGLRVEVCNKGTCISPSSSYSMKITNLENQMSVTNEDCGVVQMKVPSPDGCYWSSYYPDSLLGSEAGTLWGVKVQADYKNDLGKLETNVANNVKECGVDLVVASIKGSSEGMFDIEYCNDGDLTVDGEFRIRLENKNNGKAIVSQPITEVPAPHQCDHYFFPCKIVQASCVGPASLIADIDTENSIHEVNEDNNRFVTTLV